MARDLPLPPDHGANIRVVMKAANKYGCVWEVVPKSGDADVWHPHLPDLGKCRFSNHRGDAPRHLTQWVRQVHERLDERRKPEEE